jgi:microcystin-dependent protein
MATTTQIPQLPALLSADDSDLIHIRSGSIDYKITKANLLTEISTLLDEIKGLLTSTGSGSNYILTTGRGITTLSVATAFVFKANHNNTGACTLQVDSAGAVGLKTLEGLEFVADDIDNGGIYFAVYDGTDFIAINAPWSASETRKGLAEQATQAEVDTGTDDERYATPLKLKNWIRDASESIKGFVQKASQAEVDAATNDTKYITPAHLGSVGITGSIIMMGGPVVPSGYLECKGGTVSRTTYANLYAAIGNTWGSGNGSTTFNLPDFRGEFPRGWDNGRGIDSGRNIGSSQSDQLGSHSHTFTAQQYIGGYTDNGGAPDQRSTAQSRSTSSTGGNETRPRNIAVMFCIRT